MQADEYRDRQSDLKEKKKLICILMFSLWAKQCFPYSLERKIICNIYEAIVQNITSDLSY